MRWMKKTIEDMSPSDIMQLGNMTLFAIVFLIAAFLGNVKWMVLGMVFYVSTFVLAYVFRKKECKREWQECLGLVFHAIGFIGATLLVFNFI